MSKFNNSSSFFKRSTNQIFITEKTKKSQKERKKNNKLSTGLNNVSDKDFEELMNETNENSISNKKTEILFQSYLNKIKMIESPTTFNIDNLGKGDELQQRVSSFNITGIELLKCILDKFTDSNEYTWIELQEYGLGLKKLFEDDLEEQLLCLIAIQDYSILKGLPKIIYKNKEVYYIKLIFQLLFTYDIVDESVYWKWQDLMYEFTDIDEDVKNKIFIQTTDFFNILKMTFVDEDYENDDDNENTNANINTNDDDFNNIEQKINQNKNEQDEKSETESEPDKYAVPEEQDYYMDDNDFNLDDL